MQQAQPPAAPSAFAPALKLAIASLPAPATWPTQVVSGLKALIRNPDITVRQLMQHIPAPDFPTGVCAGSCWAE